jgi:hypothetical protein
MTFALTITSIVLAILAIVYAFFSNSSFTKNIVSLNDSSKIISDASKIITSSSVELNNKIGDIPKLLDKIDKKTDHTISKLNELKLYPPPTSKKIDVDIKDYDDESVYNLLHKISANGLRTLYFIKLSYNLKKSFNLEETSEHFEFSKDYSYAFLMPLSSLGFFKYKEIENNGEFDWLVTDLNDKIDNELISAIDYYNTEILKDSIPELQIDKNEIEMYFEIN